MHKVIDNVILIGTSHVSKNSVKEINDVFEQHDVGAIGVELDNARLHKLLTTKQERSSTYHTIKHFGVRAGLFASIAGAVQQKIGKVVKLEAGSDMKEAVLLGRKNNIPVACIDQHIAITLKKLNKVLNLKFIWQLFKDFCAGLFTPEKVRKKYGLKNINLKSVPSQKIIDTAMKVMQTDYPGLYDILVHQRNVVMANNILQMKKHFPNKKIMIVIGAGHMQGIEELLKTTPQYSLDLQANEFSQWETKYKESANISN